MKIKTKRYIEGAWYEKIPWLKVGKTILLIPFFLVGILLALMFCLGLIGVFYTILSLFFGNPDGAFNIWLYLLATFIFVSCTFGLYWAGKLVD